MVFTNVGKEFMALRLGSSLPDMYVATVGIGSGSGTVAATDVTLINEVSRVMITGSPDFTTVQKVSFQGDFNSSQMSGTHLTEFGLFQSGATNIGSTWQREGFGSIVFDGTNELQILSTLDVI